MAETTLSKGSDKEAEIAMASQSIELNYKGIHTNLKFIIAVDYASNCN